MSLFDPASIAVIGASATPGKVGHDILKNLLTQGYTGGVFPVNPKGGEILGARAYATIAEIPQPVEMAIIVTPAPTVVALARECGEKGVRTLVVISAGFKEVGTAEGKAMEEALALTARQYGMRLVGANCLGLLRPSLRMNASFAKELPPNGRIALISQSGALAVAMMDGAAQMGMGFSAVVSIGNKTACDECDYLEACMEDAQTSVIGMYLESINDGARFRSVAARVAQHKHVVLLKAGTSAHGQLAVSSHTGALAGSDAAITAVCRQTGIHRVRDYAEFTDTLRALCLEPPLQSHRIAIVTNAGGPGILATDAAERHRLSLPALAPRSVEILRAGLPGAASTKNPVDVLGDADADRYALAVEACFDDPSIDGVTVLMTPQVMTPCEEIARRIVQIARKFPLFPVTASFVGGESVRGAIDILTRAEIPCFDTPERAVRAMGSLLSAKAAPREDAPPAPDAQRALKAKSIIAGKSGQLSAQDTARLCDLYALPIPKSALAGTADDAAALAADMGFPVIAKVSARDILHKTDVGGVRANLRTAADVRTAFDDIMAAVTTRCPSTPIDGVQVQQFLPAGNEFIVGGVRDAAFGHVVLVGLGGIYTELFRDTSTRLAPVSERDGYAMLQELTAWRLLLGMRGAAQDDIDGLVRVVCAVSAMLTECPDIRELDMNPVIVRPDGIHVADAKIVVG